MHMDILTGHFQKTIMLMELHTKSNTIFSLEPMGIESLIGKEKERV